MKICFHTFFQKLIVTCILILPVPRKHSKVWVHLGAFIRKVKPELDYICAKNSNSSFFVIWFRTLKKKKNERKSERTNERIRIRINERCCQMNNKHGNEIHFAVTCYRLNSQYIFQQFILLQNIRTKCRKVNIIVICKAVETTEIQFRLWIVNECNHNKQ